MGSRACNRAAPISTRSVSRVRSLRGRGSCCCLLKKNRMESGGDESVDRLLVESRRSGALDPAQQRRAQSRVVAGLGCRELQRDESSLTTPCLDEALAIEFAVR